MAEFNLFGWLIRRSPEAIEKQEKKVSFTPPVMDDGALVVAAPAGGAYGTYVDLEGTVKTEAELVTRYREMSLLPEVDEAIEDIVNEAIVVDDDDYIVKINLDHIEGLSDTLKTIIEKEFDEVLKLLDFENYAFDLFKRWYVDGRMYFHAMIDMKNPHAGLIELRYIDPRKIRKVREMKDIISPSGITLKQVVDEYYVYSDLGFNAQTPQSTFATATQTSGIKIALDSIIYITSGVMDKNNTMVLSYLHKAIKPLNQLRALEDATVIYTLARAPERRVFYIDVGNLPQAKAAAYLQDMMIKHKNKLVYDAATGEIRDDRKFMTMLEDYWLPRREGGRGTEVDTLPAGENTGVMEHVEYFLKKLMKSLGVPLSRLDPTSGFSLGRASEISRDEVKFSKFVGRMRKRFSMIFLKSLEKNLVLKGICSQKEWKEWERKIIFDYKEDNHFAELKDQEIQNGRAQAAIALQPLVGHYYSHKYVRKMILKQDDDMMEQMDAEIKEEAFNPQYANMMMDPMGGGGPPPDDGMGGFGEDQPAPPFGTQPEDVNSNPPVGGPQTK